MDILFDHLVAWFAPFVCFTAEEAWLARHGESRGSVHERVFPTAPAEWDDPELAERWARVRAVRRVVTGAIELERAAKRIGSSLQAAPSVWVSGEHMAALDGLNLADIAIVSAVELAVGEPPDGAFTLPDVEGVGVIVGTAQGDKCDRCWKVLPEVRPHRDDHKLCRRCADAVNSLVGAG